MIENLLYFALGLLTTLFIVLLIAPFIWNRAVTLTERQLTKRVNPDVKAKIAQTDHRLAEIAMQHQQVSAIKRELEQENAQLEVELAKLRDQIKSLKSENRSLKQAGEITNDSIALKKEITQLAAEMTAITAVLEGEDSPILEALNKKNAKGNGQNSLANKIKLLRKKIKIKTIAA